MKPIIYVIGIIVAIVAIFFVYVTYADAIVDEPTDFPAPPDEPETTPEPKDVNGYWGVDVWMYDLNTRTRVSVFEEWSRPFWGVGYGDIQAYTLGIDLYLKGESNVDTIELDVSSFTTTFMITDASPLAGGQSIKGVSYDRQYPSGIITIPTDNEYHHIHGPSVDIHQNVLEYKISNSGTMRYRKVFETGVKSDWTVITDIPSLTFVVDFSADTITGSYS